MFPTKSVKDEWSLECRTPEETFTFCVCSFLSQPPMCSTQVAPLSWATSEASTIPVAASAPRFQGECGIFPGPEPVLAPCWAQLTSSVCSFQGAQTNPGFKLLPDWPGRPPASLRGWLLLSFQYVHFLQQPEQDCQISQRSLSLRNLPPLLMLADCSRHHFILFVKPINAPFMHSNLCGF